MVTTLNDFVETLEKVFTDYERAEWPVEMKMYAKVYGDLVDCVPFYNKKLLSEEKMSYSQIFNIEEEGMKL